MLWGSDNQGHQCFVNVSPIICALVRKNSIRYWSLRKEMTEESVRGRGFFQARAMDRRAAIKMCVMMGMNLVGQGEGSRLKSHLLG